MKKVTVLLLFSVIIVFSAQPAINNNGLEIILKDDGSYLSQEIPDEAGFPVLPHAGAVDSQFALLKKKSRMFVFPDDAGGTLYDTVTVPETTSCPVERKGPIIRFLPRPEYPASVFAQKLEGTTVVKLLVDTDGNVVDVSILKSSGHMILDQVAIKTVWKAMFTPAKFNGIPVRAWVKLPFRFRLKDDK